MNDRQGMQTIYRYSIVAQAGLVPDFSLRLPVDSEILFVEVQQRPPHEPCLWVRLNLDKPTVELKFHIVGTGFGEIDPSWKYVGSWQDAGFVWHLFKEEE